MVSAFAAPATGAWASQGVGEVQRNRRDPGAAWDVGDRRRYRDYRRYGLPARDRCENLGQEGRLLLAVKGNQGTLREDVELFATEQKASGFTDTKVSRHETVDGDHRRIETRMYTAFHDVAWLQERHDWPDYKVLSWLRARARSAIRLSARHVSTSRQRG